MCMDMHVKFLAVTNEARVECCCWSTQHEGPVNVLGHLLIFTCTSGTDSPGQSQTKGHKTIVVVVVGMCNAFIVATVLILINRSNKYAYHGQECGQSLIEVSVLQLSAINVSRHLFKVDITNSSLKYHPSFSCTHSDCRYGYCSVAP